MGWSSKQSANDLYQNCQGHLGSICPIKTDWNAFEHVWNNLRWLTFPDLYDLFFFGDFEGMVRTSPFVRFGSYSKPTNLNQLSTSWIFVAILRKKWPVWGMVSSRDPFKSKVVGDLRSPGEISKGDGLLNHLVVECFHPPLPTANPRG